ncbi:MAG: hypothetical protein KDE27_02200 [Planctomycetes bacterium]|nr:hypothetical protein [Planctomycetota bacterium]
MHLMLREISVVGSLALLALATWAFEEREVVPEPAAVRADAAGATVAEDTDGSAAAAAASATVDQPAPDHSREIELPDGSFVPALNGAIDAAPVGDFWGPQPWSPIVGVERNSVGLDWYRHEDGSYSTTQMVWRSDLGRNVAMTRVAHPGPTPPAIAR